MRSNRAVMRKVPMRKCVVTQQRLPKKELVRIVRTPEGAIKVDQTGKMNGRGAYLKLSSEVVNLAQKSKVLAQILESEIPMDIFEELLALIEE